MSAKIGEAVTRIGQALESLPPSVSDALAPAVAGLILDMIRNKGIVSAVRLRAARAALNIATDENLAHRGITGKRR